jgi:hypothetical protein
MKKLLFLLTLVCVFAKSEAQWTQGGNDGAPPRNIFDLDSFQLTLNNYGIYKTINNGQSWHLIPCPGVQYIDLFISSGRIFATTVEGIYVSDDYGVSWSASNSGISGPGNAAPKSIVKLPNTDLLYSNSNSLYKSINNGNTWVILNTSPTGIRNIIFDSISNLLVCATQTGITASYDLGLTWNSQNNGLTSTNIAMIENLNGSWFCVTTNNNIFVSQNNSFQWALASGLTGTYINPRILIANNLLLANRTTGVHVYNFNTSQFELSPLNQSFNVVIEQGINQIFFGGEIVSNKPDFYNSTYTYDSGINWNYTRGLRNSAVLGFNQLNNDKLSFDYAGAGCFSASLDSSYYIIGPPYVFGSISGNISNSLKYQNQKFYCATNSGIWISNDSAQTWVQYTSGLPQTPPSNYFYTYDLEVFGDTIIVSTDQGPYISTNGGNSFSIANFPGTTSSKDLVCHNGKLYSAGSPKMLVSSDLGANWLQFGSLTTGFLKIYGTGNYIYSSDEQEIYFTNDTVGITSNISGNIGQFMGPGSNPSIAAIDSLLFVSAFFRVGVQKMNINQPGVYTDISDNLPVYEETPGFYQYPYMNGGSALTIFDNKLWLGTTGMSCFTRPLSDFGYPPVVTEYKKKEITSSQDAFRIYPNPGTELLNVKLNYSHNKANEIHVINASGNKVLQIEIDAQKDLISFSIQHFPKGIYILKVIDDKGNFNSMKFVKE